MNLLLIASHIVLEEWSCRSLCAYYETIFLIFWLIKKCGGVCVQRSDAATHSSHRSVVLPVYKFLGTSV